MKGVIGEWEKTCCVFDYRFSDLLKLVWWKMAFCPSFKVEEKEGKNEHANQI